MEWMEEQVFKFQVHEIIANYENGSDLSGRNCINSFQIDSSNWLNRYALFSLNFFKIL